MKLSDYTKYDSVEEMIKDVEKCIKYTFWEKIKIKYWSIIPSEYRPGTLYYRLKCFVWYRYTTVKPKTMPWNTWTDCCDLLPHIMFQILCDFIEKEHPYEHFDTEDPHHREEWIKLRNLYFWWINIYVPYYQDDLNELLFERFEDKKEYWELQEKMEKELTDKMIELCSLRHLLWT